MKKISKVLGNTSARLFVVATVAASMLLVMSGTASANYGPHGGYDTDTDACAGCHRAHTAVSEITYDTTPGVAGGEKNSLLIGTTATTLKEFCYTCHADAGTGAITDVSRGTLNKTGNVALNGGGFESMVDSMTGTAGATVSSTHDVSGAGGLAWGGGADGAANDGPGVMIAGFDCASCHDPHGSSNYRILKDKVNGIDVGGYAGGIDSGPNPTPQPYVVSNEDDFPAGGFGLHVTTASLDYEPDFTTARYAKAPTYAVTGNTPAPGKVATDTDTSAGMSGWCGACHTTYNTVSADGQGEYNADGYDPAVGYGDAVRHRHPVNVALSSFVGDRSLIVDGSGITNTPWGDTVDIPLEHNPATEAPVEAEEHQVNTAADLMGCLTCHRAHGTDATMAGYADSSSNVVPNKDAGVGGTVPTLSSALLRADNRGVCERCHNK